MALIAVVGSRDFANLDLVARYVEHREMHVVTGDAVGVDRTAWVTNRDLCRPYTIYPYRRALGKGGGFARNKEIVAFADGMVCFWDGASRGTAHDIYLWHMKVGRQPLVFDADGHECVVSYKQVQEILNGGR